MTRPRPICGRCLVSSCRGLTLIEVSQHCTRRCEPCLDVLAGRAECPVTHGIAREIPGIVNCGFSCLGPKAETGWHQDVDRG